MEDKIEKINKRLEQIETKLNTTLSSIEGNNYHNKQKDKKMLEQWLGVLYAEFRKELKKTKQEIIKEIKNGTKNR